MTRFEIFTITLAIGGFVGIAQPFAQSQTPAPPPAGQHQNHAAPAAPAAATQGHDMMAMHQKMMAEMTAMDTKLDDLVARMAAATGPAKVDAIAEVVTAMAAQHKVMHGRMMEMHDHMMQMHGQMMPMDQTAKPVGGRMGGMAR